MPKIIYPYDLKQVLVDYLKKIVPDYQAHYEAELFIIERLNISQADILINKSICMGDDISQELDHFITCRIELRQPLQYILGHGSFYGEEYRVTPATLIPRPETEILVEKALEMSHQYSDGNILDIGTGSGCIIISLAQKRGLQFNYYATDISWESLEVAKENAYKLIPQIPVQFLQADLFPNLKESFAMIVSNPPYISEEEYKTLEPEIKDHEPYHALVADDNGFKIIKTIIQSAKKSLVTGGQLILEIGQHQCTRTQELLLENHYEKILITQDLAGMNRVISAVNVPS